MSPDPSSYPELWFVRHGETDWNLQRRIQGQTDIPLNATGHAQAAAIAQAVYAAHGLEVSFEKGKTEPFIYFLFRVCLVSVVGHNFTLRLVHKSKH